MFNLLIVVFTASFMLGDDDGMLVFKRERGIIPSSSGGLATSCSDEGDLQTNESLFSLFFFFLWKEKEKKKRGTHFLNFLILLGRGVWHPVLFRFTVSV